MWALPGTCLEPSNIMCSNKCAKPVRPGNSFAGPTWYQIFVETSGSRWSSDRITTSPFASVYFSNLIAGSAISAEVPAEETAVLPGAFFGGAFFGDSWLKTDTVRTATVRHKISKRLRSAEFIP